MPTYVSLIRVVKQLAEPFVWSHNKPYRFTCIIAIKIESCVIARHVAEDGGAGKMNPLTQSDVD